jgi:hypothetical protein
MHGSVEISCCSVLLLAHLRASCESADSNAQGLAARRDAERFLAGAEGTAFRVCGAARHDTVDERAQVWIKLPKIMYSHLNANQNYLYSLQCCGMIAKRSPAILFKTHE